MVCARYHLVDIAEHGVRPDDSGAEAHWVRTIRIGTDIQRSRAQRLDDRHRGRGVALDSTINPDEKNGAGDGIELNNNYLNYFEYISRNFSNTVKMTQQAKYFGGSMPVFAGPLPLYDSMMQTCRRLRCDDPYRGRDE